MSIYGVNVEEEVKRKFKMVKLDCYIHMQRLIEQGKLPNTTHFKKWFITMAKLMGGNCSVCNLENINLSN